MKELAHMLCLPCSEGAVPMPENQCRRLLENLPGWQLVSVDQILRLQRTFTFPDFKNALAFTRRIGELAEAEQHHPEILTAWGKVTVTWWTHSLKGLHMNDFIMAARTSELETHQ
jgi:4a-hydroxytetrahydrobiopterin dehydratase